MFRFDELVFTVKVEIHTVIGQLVDGMTVKPSLNEDIVFKNIFLEDRLAKTLADGFFVLKIVDRVLFNGSDQLFKFFNRFSHPLFLGFFFIGIVLKHEQRVQVLDLLDLRAATHQ